MARSTTAVPPCRSPGESITDKRGSEIKSEIPTRPDTESLWRALGDVLDPEIPVSVVDLGLICDIRRRGRVVEVDVTFTSTACPAVRFIKEDIHDRLRREPDVDRVQVNEAWAVAWTSNRISDQGREQMRRYGITI